MESYSARVCDKVSLLQPRLASQQSSCLSLPSAGITGAIIETSFSVACTAAVNHRHGPVLCRVGQSWLQLGVPSVKGPRTITTCTTKCV